MVNTLPYRPCVGIALFNHDGRVFVGERIDTPGAWQMPQGGIDSGEEIKTAALRELAEETGIETADIFHILENPLRYTFPKDLQPRVCGGHYAGQDQIWVAARFTGTDKDINLNAHAQPEFSNWQWIPLSETINHIVPFKKDIYRQVITAFSMFQK